MLGRYKIGEVVKYQKKLYIVVYALPMNWFMEYDPIIYGLVLANKAPREDKGIEIYVREDLLEAASEQEIQVWRVLYGKD